MVEIYKINKKVFPSSHNRSLIFKIKNIKYVIFSVFISKAKKFVSLYGSADIVIKF